MDREQILNQLAAAQQANSEVVVQVQADKDASYGTVAELLADIEQSGIHRLALLTQK
jgi:biopolymer transport protein TolR